MRDNFIEGVNVLLQCDPKRCMKDACPLYFAEEQCCDASRFLAVFNAKMRQKYEEVKTYNAFDTVDE